MMEKYIPKPTVWYVVKLGILLLLYFITTWAGLHIYSFSDSSFATFIHPETGIALAFVILYGYDLWPGIFIGSVGTFLFMHASWPLALGVAVGNTLQIIVATYFLDKNLNIFRCFERLPSTLGFISLLAICSTLTSSIIDTFVLFFTHSISTGMMYSVFVMCWTGEILSVLVVTSFLITSLAPTRPWNADSLSTTEIVAFFTTLLGLNFLIFWYSFDRIDNLPLFYFISLPLLWGATRFGSRGLTGSIFITSVIAVIATMMHRGPFAQHSVYTGFLILQLFIGTITVTFLIFLSVTKEKKHATRGLVDHIEKLQDALKQISSANEAKSDFLAILAHELRNPLAPLRSAIELMKIRNTGENSELLQTINSMDNHVRTISQLLNDLLDVSRISRNKIVLEKRNINLSEIIKNSVEMAEPAIVKYRHNLNINLPQKPIVIYADPLRMEQMIVNILNNAAKYTDPEGTITLTCASIDDMVVIRIRDTGIGIHENMLTQIFEPFLQVNGKNSHSGDGLGIGLSLSHKLATLHDGNIVAKSDGLGKGSEFVITLPIVFDAKKTNGLNTSAQKTQFTQNTTAGEDEYKKKIDVKKPRIIIIDDNQAAALGLGELLMHKGYEVELAYDGLIAIETVKKFLPDVIVLDIGLPIMNGYEVAKILRKEITHPFTLIALTGYGQAQDKIKATEAGFDYHLTKPISITDIEKILHIL
ncbi:MAG: MASE1 domain-containing protein [Patescibacteria group bacterium]